MLPVPRKRDAVTLREGREIVLDKRAVNQEAAMAQLRGQVCADACEHCKKGSGPFESCVVLRGFFKGSCANCHYGSEGKRCSFRPGSKWL
jgi:hypothetical protein